MKADVNGISINYEVSGNEGKPWITFAHALCNDLTLWDDQAALLADDFHILRYDHRGLGQFHMGEKKVARKTWGGGIKTCSQDPWVYRADWAYVNSKGRKRGGFSTAGKRNSLLNRIGYMGRRNPDLSGPEKKIEIRRNTSQDDGKKGG